MKKLTLLVPGLWMLLAELSGQVSLVPAEGFKVLPVLEYPSPGPFDLYGDILYLSADDTIHAVDPVTGNTLRKYGNPEEYDAYPSFVTVAPGGDEIWAGFTVDGNSNDRIYRINAASGDWDLAARLAGNFELVFWNGQPLVSGLNSASFSDPNGIHLLDTTGQDRHTRIMETGGYSAGLAVDSRGYLYYGTSLATGANAIYRWDSLKVAMALEAGDTLVREDGVKLTDLPAGAYDCTMDEGGHLVFSFNDFTGDKVLAIWDGSEGDGFRFDTLAVAPGALDWLGMVKSDGNICEPFAGNRVLTVSLAPGQPLAEVHRDFIPVQVFPVMPFSSLENSGDSLLDLSPYFTDPDDPDDFTFEITAISDPAVTQASMEDRVLRVSFLAPGQAKMRVRAMNAGTSLTGEILVGVQPLVTGDYLVSGMDDLELEPESYWNGSDGSGSFVSGVARFYNSYNPEWFVWTGWAYSNRSDITTPGFMNQYSAITGNGFDPGVKGSSYAVSYASPPSVIGINGEKAHTVAGIFVTNSTYAALSMEQGDDFSKKFGGAAGTDPDYFRLRIWGRKDAVSTDTVESMLADYRADSSLYDFIIKTWQWVDLSGLGKVDSLMFALESSDNSAWGMNTPAFFCLDGLCVIPDMAPVVVNPIPDITLYAAVASDTVIDLGNVFDDPDDPGAGIGKSIISMTDPSLLGASIEGDVLGISYAMAGNEQGGTTDMVVEAVSGGLSVTDTFNITLVPLSGARPARFALDIFPNPGNGRFMIETGMGEPVTVAIYGLTGNLVFSMDRYMPGGMIDLGRRPAGSYLVRIRGRNGTLSGMIHITGQN